MTESLSPTIADREPRPADRLRRLEQYGFSDQDLSTLFEQPEAVVEQWRLGRKAMTGDYDRMLLADAVLVAERISERVTGSEIRDVMHLQLYELRDRSMVDLLRSWESDKVLELATKFSEGGSV